MSAEKLMTQTPPLTSERWKDPLYYFTLLFLSFLQGLFKQRQEGKYKWSEDAELTEIIIADQITNTKETVPRIITARGPAQFFTLACDDLLFKSFRTDERKRLALISIPMTFNVIAKIGLEAQELAFFIADNIWEHRVLLQQHGIHKIDRNFSISPETPTGSVFAPEVVPEGVMVSVIIPFFVRWKSTTVPNNAPKLHEITTYLKEKLSLGTPIPETVATIDPMEDPKSADRIILVSSV